MTLPAPLINALQPVTAITGHYGTGKTNFALNLALDLAKEGLQLRLVDLDIVNPYFRSSEYTQLLEDAGVQAVTPVMAKSSLDTPSLSAAVDGAIEWAREGEGRITLIDVGGDDAGATALGRYAGPISTQPYALLYVVNAYRNLTQDPAEAATILHEIENASHLRATGVVNNSHLRTETTPDVLQAASAFGADVAEQLQLPIVAQTIPDWCADAMDGSTQTGVKYIVQMLVKTPWE